MLFSCLYFKFLNLKLTKSIYLNGNLIYLENKLFNTRVSNVKTWSHRTNLTNRTN